MAEETSSSIKIAATKADVMRVIADFPAYPEWTGAVRETDVLEAHPGGRAARVRFVLDAGVIKDEYVLGYEWENDNVVRWSLVEQGTMLSGMTGSYRLVELSGTTTEVTYELTVDVKIPMIGMFRRKAEKVIIDTALKELKKRAEDTKLDTG